MKPRQLEIFLTVVERASIHAAARSLGISQPAVTKTMRELESDLGAPLFERSIQGVVLTLYGRALVPRARLLLENARRARDEITQLREGIGGRVAIGMTTSVALTLLPSAFKAFNAKLPTADLSLTEGVRATLLAELDNGRLDFAVAHIRPEMTDPRFDCEVLFPVRFVVGARRRHPLIASRALKHLLAAQWILATSTATADPMIEEFFSRQGLPMPKRVIHAQSVTVALALVGNTDLLGLFVEPLAQSNFRSHGIIQINVREILPEFKVCVIRRHGDPLTPAAELLRECFHSSCRG
jgi:DNA-binding transcriptional LysR family regulator